MSSLKLVPHWYIRAASLQRLIHSKENEVTWYQTVADLRVKGRKAEYETAKRELKELMRELDQLEASI